MSDLVYSATNLLLLTIFVGKVHGVVVQISNFSASCPISTFNAGGMEDPSAIKATYAAVEVCISYCSSASARAVCEEGDQ